MPIASTAIAKEMDSDVGRNPVGKLRLAIEDLAETFGSRYPDADDFLARLKRVENRLSQRDDTAQRDLELLRREALLANPLLECRIAFVRREAKNRLKDIAIPAPHESNSGLKRTGYDNEIAILDLCAADTKPITLFRPDDRIIFASTASYQSVPCHHGQMPAGHLYRMDARGSNMRQLCFDQDIDAHPVVLGNGQVMFSRWDYTGINHIFLRQLMAMNPDGTGQRGVYGSNTWFPNSLFFFRPLPGQSHQLVSTLSGYHGVPRMGWLVTLDTSRGWYGVEGITRRISGVGDPVEIDPKRLKGVTYLE
jgi:hypothetical protein